MDLTGKEGLTDWVEDEGGGQVMNGTRCELSITGDLILARVEGENEARALTYSPQKQPGNHSQR